MSFPKVSTSNSFFPGHSEGGEGRVTQQAFLIIHYKHVAGILKRPCFKLNKRTYGKNEGIYTIVFVGC